MNYNVKDTIKDCKKKCFFPFEYRCVSEIQFIIAEKNEEVILTLNNGYMKFKSQFDRLGRKLKNSRKNSFRFSEIIRLENKGDSSLSDINISYYLKLPMLIMHTENSKTFCNVSKSFFHFACCRWMINQ